MFCQFLVYSKVTHLYIHSFSHIFLHHVPSQVAGYSSLCYTAGDPVWTYEVQVFWCHSAEGIQREAK